MNNIPHESSLGLNIRTLDEPGAGGANHAYIITGITALATNPSLGLIPNQHRPSERAMVILFQNGPLGAAGGTNGVGNEELLRIVAHRLQCFQSSPYACVENEEALCAVLSALEALDSRTQRRQNLGIEGTHAKDPAPGEDYPVFLSHKKVRALKIAEVLAPGEDGLTTLVIDSPDFADVKVDQAYVDKHDPQPGGYWVRYPDGYESWSPAEAFESGYRCIWPGTPNLPPQAEEVGEGKSDPEDSPSSSDTATSSTPEENSGRPTESGSENTSDTGPAETQSPSPEDETAPVESSPDQTSDESTTEEERENVPVTPDA